MELGLGKEAYTAVYGQGRVLSIVYNSEGRAMSEWVSMAQTCL